MRELTISELSIVSGGGLGKAVLDFAKAEVLSLSAEKAWESAQALAAQAMAAMEQYNKDQNLKLTPEDMKALEDYLKEEAEKNTSTDYCNCGGGYSD
ncbi:hypothetical protein ACX0AN_003171 [Acinetobacter baumannii]|uniref:hypothetical protein n=1 Tax=Acinetobacter baumannii TaxID=470 RepID=UPI0002BAE813|nr:hypothetical protein [Acinetobacter baumannii]EHU3240345.1 hypothetical protein [Acinetobacter baumannii]EJB8462184.1 hypothetical protein [Acinetobacter baumannii]EJB8477961.1 hypothetical protein [Acinetobacter baumannii]EJB8552687.1 hypothetical protein [Acinetobacter baumannii]EJB8569794.1 hypothetical protein [Acinetobacter baumannii]